MINFVVPMAGKGSRFSNNFFKKPKPLLEVGRQTMIEFVLKNLKPEKYNSKFYLVCQKIYKDTYNFEEIISNIGIDYEILYIDYFTDGPASSALLAINKIQNNDPIIIANCDQYIDFKIDNFIKYGIDYAYDGLILTMNDLDNKWSFINYENALVTEVREKEVISNEATVGIYFFKNSYIYKSSFEEMYKNDFKVNNEFYVGPIYNYLIKSGGIVSFMNIGKYREKMFGLGDPNDYHYFINNILNE